MNKLVFCINLIGLIFDLLGFIGLYRLNSSKMRPIIDSVRVGKFFGESDKQVLENLNTSIIKSFNDFNSQIETKTKKSLKYFILVMIGVCFQILGISLGYIIE
jgi:multisubunit Na+/H+ antiporter MnhG subunit